VALGVTGLIALVLSVALYAVRKRVTRGEDTHVLTMAIVEGTSRTQLLAYEYGRTPSPRVGTQLTTQLALLQRLVDSLPVVAIQAHASRAAVESGARRLKALTADLRGHEGPSDRESELLRGRLLEQMQAESQRLVGDALALSRAEHAAAGVAEGRLHGLILLGLLGFLAIALGLAWLFTRRVGQRLEMLQAGAAAWAAGDLEHRVPAIGTDEVGALGQSFNQMASELRSIWGQLLIEVEERRRTGEVLERRLRQQAAVARFGAEVLAGATEPALREAAVAAVAEGLGVEFTALLEPLADPAAGLRILAGRGWPADVIATTVVPAGDGSQAGYTLATGGPVVADDLENERRFAVPALVAEYRRRSGISVVVRGDRALGVLIAHANELRSFTSDDVAFMQSVASLLAGAVSNREAEAALRRSEQRYLDLYDNAPAMYVSVDVATGRIADCNATTARALGYRRNELLGRPVFDLYTPASRAAAQAALARLRERGELHDVELAIQRRDGSVLDISLRASLIRDPDGSARFGRTAWVDITDRKRREREVEEATERLRLALASGNQGLWELDVATGEAMMSPEYCRLLGFEPDELNQGRAQFGEQVHPDDLDRVSRVFRDYLDGRLPNYTVEFRQRTKRGDWKWLLSVGRVVQWDARGRPVRMLGTCSDIHERKLAEDELRESRERLRQLGLAQEQTREAERSRIARELHDELGAALTGIRMDVSWLRDRLPARDADGRDRVKETLDLVDATVESVRRISAELRPGVLDDLGLASAIRWQAGEFGRRAGIAVTVTDLDVIPPSINGHRATAVFRILQEALTNVARHAGASAVEIVAMQVPGALRLEIRDDGRGYAPHGGGRVPLGILGMQERAAAWGGEVTVARRAPQGTVVTVRMPVPD
jgi:two-component system sensor histidine kinase UhpB